MIVVIVWAKKSPPRWAFSDGLSDPFEVEDSRKIFLREFVDPDPACAGWFVRCATSADGAGFTPEIGDDVSHSNGFEGLRVDKGFEV